MTDDIKLDDYEQEIESLLDDGNINSVENIEEELVIAKQAANNYMRKSERISVRLTPHDLQVIKANALEEGIPYQTLVGSILHKFVTGRLVDSHHNKD